MDKKFAPASFEDRIYAEWEQNNYFGANVDPDKKPFVIMMPPPNITGQLHMGHALNNSLQDIIIRFKRMQGYSALWLPGTDHASIATELKIVDKLKDEGLDKREIGREKFLEHAWDWKKTYGGRIVTQLRKLGCSCDWSREAFTMDENLSRAVRHVFVKLYNKGLVYKENRITNFCTGCRTALSDAEVEFEEKNSFLWHIRYPLEDGSGDITVATTRPETMLGDTAVAVNPDDPRYAALVGKSVILPLVGRRIPIVADSYVERGFGTGAVKITPAHDPNDFEVGARHGLPVIRLIGDDGILNETAGKYVGLKWSEVRAIVVADLEKGGYLVKKTPHKHNVGHCHRCGTPAEPLAGLQWFVKMKPLAAPAIAAVKDKSVRFIPKRFEKIYLHWMENIKDWCISRQLWWGHRIPVFYCGCGEVIASEEDITVCPVCGGAVRQDEDVLDTWFSSALWPFSTLGYPLDTPDLKYFYPGDVLVTASDIIFFWVARMIFSGIENMGEPPFRDVLINGIVRDSEGRKMSKSAGNGVDPLEIIKEYGADTLRLSLIMGTSPGGDMRISYEKLDGCRNFMNKLWNAARFVLMNAENVCAEQNTTLADLNAIKPETLKNLALADKWILTRLNSIIKDATKYLEKYEAGLMSAPLYDFVWSVFCDRYIELTKPIFYGGNADGKRAAAAVLLHVLKTVLKLMHPLTPFITEEIYQSLDPSAGTIMLAAYPIPNAKTNFPAAAAQADQIIALIDGIRALRAQMNVPPSRRAPVLVMPRNTKVFAAGADYVAKLGMASELSIITAPPEGNYITVVGEAATVFIDLSGLVDIDAERARLTAERVKAESEHARAIGKLNNAGFTAKAPPALIEEEKQKAERFAALLSEINDKLFRLS